MKLSILNLNKRYSLSFNTVTQLCGRNIPLKKFFLDSICKHFSSEKYKEYEENLIDNVMIDGEVPGRKQWECRRINSIESVLASIQMSKGSMLEKCMKECISSFDCQHELHQIDTILYHILDIINQKMFEEGTIQLSYNPEDLFGIIQKTTITTLHNNDIHEMTTMQLLDVFIDIISKQQELIPEKRLYIFENLDHMLNAKEYKSFVLKCVELSKQSNVWFIFSTSLDEFVFISDDTIEGINVINDEIFIMPALEHVIQFIKNSYPLEIYWDHECLERTIERIIHRIGLNDELIQPKELVLLKMINETNNVKMKWNVEPKSPEIQFLIANM